MKSIEEYILENELDNILLEYINENNIINESYKSKVISELTKNRKMRWLVDKNKLQSNDGSADSSGLVFTKDGKTIPGINEVEDSDIIAYFSEDKQDGETQDKKLLEQFKSYFGLNDLSFKTLIDYCKKLDNNKTISKLATHIWPQSMLLIYKEDTQWIAQSEAGNDLAKNIYAIVFIMQNATSKIGQKFFKQMEKNKEKQMTLSDLANSKEYQKVKKLLDTRLDKFKKWLEDNKKDILDKCKNIQDLVSSQEYNKEIFKYFNVILKLYKNDNESQKFLAKSFWEYLSFYTLGIINNDTKTSDNAQIKMYDVYSSAIVIAKRKLNAKAIEELRKKTEELMNKKINDKTNKAIDDLLAKAA